MRLFEFADDDPLRVKLTGVAMQLKTQAEESGQPMPLDEFLGILNDNGISVDPSDVFDLIKKEPLVNIVDSIENKQVVFKGMPGTDIEGDEQGEPGENEKILQQMASKQTAKLS
jgi:hypothetical protein